MDVKLLIDDIVRQTTVLVAQLATASGVRAPLAHVADQVFFELAKEIESQGVGRKVVADMFGLALRSYQLKFQRLTESARSSTSLWQAVYRKLEQEPRTRQALYDALAPEAPEAIAAVLHDLTGSGLAYASGRGSTTLFGLTTDADRQRVSHAERHQALSHLVWQLVATRRAQTMTDLRAQLSTSEAALTEALDGLTRDGRITREDDQLRAAELLIPVGAEQGWEAAVVDHFRAVATAIAAKLRVGQSQAGDVTGGATLSFTVYPGHPHEPEVYGLLERARADVNGLWRRVADYNRAVPPPEDARRVTFYFGQHVNDPRQTEQGEKSDEIL